MLFNTTKIGVIAGILVAYPLYSAVAQPKDRWTQAQCNGFADKENRTSEVERLEREKRWKMRDSIKSKSWSLSRGIWCLEAKLQVDSMRIQIDRRKEFERQCPSLKKDQRCDSRCWAPWLETYEKDVKKYCASAQVFRRLYRMEHEGRMLWFKAREMQAQDRTKAAELYKAAASKFAGVKGFEGWEVMITDEMTTGVIAPSTRDPAGDTAPSPTGMPRTDSEACRVARLLSATYKREGIPTTDEDAQINLECEPVR